MLVLLQMKDWPMELVFISNIAAKLIDNLMIQAREFHNLQIPFNRQDQPFWIEKESSKKWLLLPILWIPEQWQLIVRHWKLWTLCISRQLTTRDDPRWSLDKCCAVVDHSFPDGQGETSPKSSHNRWINVGRRVWLWPRVCSLRKIKVSCYFQ